ncbi:MAG: bile acid:sodium symporter family protein [Prevotellaceae bacterium]|nr:bile acid:sodium symporter family protein [Candidatus Faecinaster equi]
MNTIFIVIPILTLLMFDLGLTLCLDDFKLVFKRPKSVLAGMIGQLIILPAIALFLAWYFKLEPLFFIGIVLIACCPGGSSSNVFSKLANGDVALSVSLTALSSIITLFTIPLILNYAVSLAGTGNNNIDLPIGNLIMQNIVLALVPILIGIGIHYQFPNTAKKIDNILSKIAFPAIILLATVFYFQNTEAICNNFSRLGFIITILIIFAIIVARLLSFPLKLNNKEKKTITIEIGMQNAAQAITIATSPLVFNNEVIAVPAIIYSLMMNVILIIYVLVAKKILS